MSLTNSSPAPQPYRGDEWQERFAYEAEMWDNQANVVYEGVDETTDIIESQTANLVVLTVPCPVPTRIQVTAKSTVVTPDNPPCFARLHGFVQGQEFPAAVEINYASEHTVNNSSITLPWCGAVDVQGGVYTIILQAEASAAAGTYTFSGTVVDARRGRKPVQ